MDRYTHRKMLAQAQQMAKELKFLSLEAEGDDQRKLLSARKDILNAIRTLNNVKAS